jgi:pilus assembly protein Flp/PilA
MAHFTCEGANFKKFLTEEDGATAIEYGLIAGLIAVAVIAGFTEIGGALTTKFAEISTALTG